MPARSQRLPKLPNRVLRHLAAVPARLPALGVRLWHSPTMTTWASLGFRAAGAVAVLPVLLRTLSPPEIIIWYLIATVISINSLLDMGFNPSFTRAVAYAIAAEGPGRDRRLEGSSLGTLPQIYSVIMTL